MKVEIFYYVSLMSKDYSLEDNFKSIADIGKQITVCKKPMIYKDIVKLYGSRDGVNFISEMKEELKEKFREIKSRLLTILLN